MSTWKIFGSEGDGFRWENSGRQLPADSPIERPTTPRQFSSIADLLVQGYSELFEEKESEKIETPPTFRTGLGKSVSVKPSSIAKAMSILGARDDSIADTGQSEGRAHGGNFSNSMFQTGSGKSVNISSTGLIRARILLGLEENTHEEFKGFEMKRKQEDASESCSHNDSSHQQMAGSDTNLGYKDPTSIPRSQFSFLSGAKLKDVTPGSVRPAPRPTPIKFHTAGGRSISVSGDALKRARSLLGDPDLGDFANEIDAYSPQVLFNNDRSLNKISSNKENNQGAYCARDTSKIKQMSKNFISPMRSTSYEKKSSIRLRNLGPGNNLMKQFDEEENESTCKKDDDVSCWQRPSSNRPCATNGVREDSLENSIVPSNFVRRPSIGPLVDISNHIDMNARDDGQTVGAKKQSARRLSASSFKRPRSSKFITPLNKSHKLVADGMPSVVPEESCCRKRVSTRYPFLAQRKYIREYFGSPPTCQNMFEQMPHWIRRMNSENADRHMFRDGSGVISIGIDTFFDMLAQSGSSYVSKEWVKNHYRWIVWKLACYERCYPAEFSGKLLTVSNVLEELKYRYEREINHGHRSALKRILEGDAPPSSTLVLCISSIHSKCDAEIGDITSNGGDDSMSTTIELTDGWYSLNGLLDELLSKQLAAGKLFVGQKLKICGAGLCGWVGPVSPLEASETINLRLHINGTYRAHWADRLGFCKTGCPPLAFSCIKGTGGMVPNTLVGVTRVYPVLYRERLNDGGFVVRSERMETKMMQLYNQKCSNLAEGIMSEFEIGVKGFQILSDQNTGDEGEQISKILETAAEPEVLMAGMSSKQLSSFTTYQAKLEAMRQSEMQKSIEKALEDAGLSKREVNPLMRVRVVGLSHKSDIRRRCPRRGLITIWNPTEKQQLELVEGQAYAIAGLTPVSSDSDTVYLHARGSTTKWKPLSPSTTEQFQPFFSPRKPISLSNIGEVPLSSEFDIAAFVIYVGEVQKSTHQKKQWVFVTDGTISKLHSEESYGDLLAISFCSPSIDCDSIVPINYNLAGSTVGFCNLIKRPKDQMNQIWVAEATENSTYFLNYHHANTVHLKDMAASADRWAKNSTTRIEKLKEKVFSIIINK